MKSRRTGIWILAGVFAAICAAWCLSPANNNAHPTSEPASDLPFDRATWLDSGVQGLHTARFRMRTAAVQSLRAGMTQTQIYQLLGLPNGYGRRSDLGSNNVFEPGGFGDVNSDRIVYEEIFQIGSDNSGGSEWRYYLVVGLGPDRVVRAACVSIE